MHRDDIHLEDTYVNVINEALTTQPPAAGVQIKQPILPAFQASPVNQNNQEAVKKETQPVKDWIRLPFIDTPFKARMAAVLIVELIYNMTKDIGLRDLVLKEIRTNNRLNRK